MKRVRIGIIGAGGIVKSRHLPGLGQIEGVAVVAVCNRSRASGEAVAREWGIPEVAEDWPELVRRPDLDARRPQAAAVGLRPVVGWFRPRLRSSVLWS